MTSATVKPPNEPAVKAGSRFRPDIQGLRAIAVGLVLLYHAGLTWLPGGYVGVDVFFVISGFLITGMLVRQSLEKGRIDLADFYARRIRRILPAATVVLVFVAIFTLVLLPRTRWESIGTEIVGS
ncbi:MAG: acyltransferase, partial [Yaniella sp.]|nr:acyltransferase [Yaniella sp.]